MMFMIGAIPAIALTVFVFFGVWICGSKAKRTSFLNDSFFHGNKVVAEFFLRYYNETNDFPIPHLMIFGKDPVDLWKLEFDYMGRLLLRLTFDDKGINILNEFRDPFNPSEDELILWQIDHNTDYEEVMSSFFKNWKYTGGDSWTPL